MKMKSTIENIEPVYAANTSERRILAQKVLFSRLHRAKDAARRN